LPDAGAAGVLRRIRSSRAGHTRRRHGSICFQPGRPALQQSQQPSPSLGTGGSCRHALPRPSAEARPAQGLGPANGDRYNRRFLQGRDDTAAADSESPRLVGRGHIHPPHQERRL